MILHVQQCSYSIGMFEYCFSHATVDSDGAQHSHPNAVQADESPSNAAKDGLPSASNALALFFQKFEF